MSERDWNLIGTGGRLTLAVVTVHGVTTRRWRDAHTFGVLLCLVAIAGRELMTS